MKCILFISLCLFLSACLPKADISVKNSTPSIDFDISNLKFENSCFAFKAINDNVQEAPPAPGREMHISFESGNSSITISQYNPDCVTGLFSLPPMAIILEANYPSPNHSNSFYIVFSYLNPGDTERTYLQMFAQKENNNLRILNSIRVYFTTPVDSDAFENDSEASSFNLDPTQNSFLMTPY